MSTSARARILVVDDDAGTRILIGRALESQGYEVREAESVATALLAIDASLPDVAVLDFSLPDGEAFGVLSRLRRDDAQVPVVMLTGHASIELAIRAIKAGAEQFLVKPVDFQALLLVIERIVANQRSRQVAIAQTQRRLRREIDPFSGDSPAIRKLAVQAERVAATTLPVLILGETGTGKGVLTNWLHRNGPRSSETFLDLNCAGLSVELLESELFGHERGAFTGAVATKPGLLELAHRGTLFLDEIGEMDMRVQPKLLKVVEQQRFRRLGGVQEREVDLRLISATHRNLAEAVRDGRFREDLLYRAGAVTLTVPPLRERGNDILHIARTLVEELRRSLGRAEAHLTAGAEAALLRHTWPGNLRELRNVLERALLFSDSEEVGEADLGEWFTPATPVSRGEDATPTLEAAERRHIEAVLKAEGYAVAEAAKALGLSRSALYEKISRHGIALRRRKPN